MNGRLPSLFYVMAALGALGFVLAARHFLSTWWPSFGQGQYRGPRFSQTKTVLVSGWNADELQQILEQFKKMYEADQPDVASLKIKTSRPSNLEIEVPDHFPGQVFAYLVNYLQYPENFDLDARRIGIVGVAELSAAAENLGSGTAYVYVPVEDRDYDLVYVKIDSGEVYEESFQNHRWKRVENDRMPGEVAKLVSEVC